MRKPDFSDFSEFYQRHGRFVRNFLFRTSAHRASSASLDDLVQETFIRAWKSRETLRDERAERAWLYRIAIRLFYDSLRVKDSQWSPLDDEVLSMSTTSEPLHEDKIDAEAALRSLPPAQRTACLLHYIEGFSTAEIAEIEDIPEGTVKTRLMKARERLRQWMEAPRKGEARNGQ
jgi:RNA polymerase sigma-70 factor (ECF subfamily)